MHGWLTNFETSSILTLITTTAFLKGASMVKTDVHVSKMKRRLVLGTILTIFKRMFITRRNSSCLVLLSTYSRSFMTVFVISRFIIPVQNRTLSIVSINGFPRWSCVLIWVSKLFYRIRGSLVLTHLGSFWLLVQYLTTALSRTIRIKTGFRASQPHAIIPHSFDASS